MRKTLRVLLWVLAIVGVIVGISRAFLLRWWRVPEDDAYLEASIAPSIRGGDLILLWRLTKPSFGDLVMCPEPDHPERIVIARILAEAGDKISIDGERVIVNDRPSATERACSEGTFSVKDPGNGHEVEQPCQIEALAGGTHMRGVAGSNRISPVKVDHEIGPGKVFLVSDNRLFPYDSRDFGSVDVDTCTETVIFRVVSKAGFFDTEHRFTFIQ